MKDTVSGIDNFATGSEDIMFDNFLFFMKINFENDFLKQAIEESKPEMIIHSAASYKDPNDFYDRYKY